MTDINILIVDDEQLVRESILYKIDTTLIHVVCIDQASDGFEALEKIQKKQYQIVITDIIMPEMSGLELIEKIRQFNNGISFIIVSGYDNFEYARQSIRLGVIDYLLKPINQDSLNGILSNIVNSIEIDKKKREIELESKKIENLVIYNDQLNDLLWRNNESNIKSVHNELMGLFKFPNYRVIVLHFKSIEDEKKIDLLSIMHILQEKINQLNPSIRVVIMRHINHKRELAILMNYQEQMEDLTILQYLIRMFIRDLSIKTAIGVGDKTNTLIACRTSYQEAYNAVLEKMIHGYNKVYFAVDVKKSQSKTSINKEKLILYFISNQEQEQLENLLGQQFQLMATSETINHKYVLKFVMDIYILLKKYTNTELTNKSDEDFIYSLYECDSIPMVQSILFETINKMMRKKNDSFDNSKQVVDNASLYIRNHSEEHLTLEYMAQMYHIHPNYFSRIFKAHKKVNFNDYITLVRMEKAKELISNIELRLQDIADLLGYNDSKYFSKVFKKYYGISPSSYREQL